MKPWAIGFYFGIREQIPLWRFCSAAIRHLEAKNSTRQVMDRVSTLCISWDCSDKQTIVLCLASFLVTPVSQVF